MLNLEERVLAEREIFTVLDDLTKRAKRSIESKQLLVIFRLSCCCGLRPGEISSLHLRDVNVDQGPPKLEVSKSRLRDGKLMTKGRIVHLDFDERTAKDIVSWRWLRYKQTNGDRFAPFICGLRPCNLGQPLDSRRLAKRWKSAIRSLGRERVKELSISAGRHSGICHFLRRGATLQAVQKFAGHARIEETMEYLKLLPQLDTQPNGRLFSL